MIGYLMAIVTLWRVHSPIRLPSLGVECGVSQFVFDRV
jgi:hypothetical protein